MIETNTDQTICLLAAISERRATVGVVGIGYVGLPLAVEKAKVGFKVLGFDRNPDRVAKANAGRSYVKDVSSVDLEDVVDDMKFAATMDFDRLRECDVIVICVPTPLTANFDPDTSYITESGKQVAAALRPGQLVCLESTTYPGTTEEVLLPLLAATGLVLGRDFFLAYSPERVDPGNQRYTTKNTSKVIGGMTPACKEVALAFYGQTLQNVVPVSSPRVAEMTKVFENTFRAVNIALVNELALLCDRLDIDVWEVVEAAATKPFGIMPFSPGPGVGGHCIPVDPFYLTWKARAYDFHTRFIELAGEVNLQMPYFVREKIIRALSADRKSVGGSNILILGVAYKRDIDDWRESPALKIIEILRRDEANIRIHDPLVGSLSLNGIDYQSEDLDPLLAWADCAVIATDHSGIDYARVVDDSRRVVDTRNATRHLTRGREKILKL